VNRVESSCHVSWCVFLKLLAHLRTDVEMGICRASSALHAQAQANGAHGVVRVLREHAREQLRYPALDRVRVAVDERADAEDRRVPLAHRHVVRRRLAGRQVRLPQEAEEPVLWRGGLAFWRRLSGEAACLEC
jgi:hypothetical protein